jgi:hypothetical protein
MRLDAADLIIGFDTEYVSEDVSAQTAEVLYIDHERAIAKGNKVLCISFALHAPATGHRRSGVVAIPPTRKRRWTLKQFIEQVLIAALEVGMVTPERLREADDRHPRNRRDGLRIVLCGHFTRADLPGFADFNVLKSKFSAVRKTYTTIMMPHVFTARPGNYRPVVSVTLRDTRLLTPAGYGSLAAIGNMLGLPKLAIPDVADEAGATVPGIKRMDLVQRRHPEVFDAYARRDAEVALTYLTKMQELAYEVGVAEIPPTIGSMAVRMFRANCTDYMSFMGRVPDPERKNALMPHHAISLNQGIWANGFHGGRNQSFAHGIFEAPEGRQWHDIDVASAYTVAMAAIPTIDWDRSSSPHRLEEIATTEAATVAQVRFRFRPGTRFPCLPARAGTSLVFPLQGETTTTGIELLAAINMGAEIEVLGAHRFEYAEVGAHEYADFTRRIAALRTRFKASNPLFEKLAKEAGNSLYGKTAQAVAGMRTINPDRTRHFDTTTGERKELPPSAITNPVHAALTTATIRAVLSEILSRLPPERAVLSVTTDGFLTDATLEEAFAATNGPACTYFKAALHMVAPGKHLLEVKHQAAEVAVARTRGAVTTKAPADYDGPPILARAGHKLEEAPADAWGEAAEFARIFRERRPDSKLLGRDFISVEDQWMADADLVALPHHRRVNLDYDFGCCPINVKEAHALLRFSTAPWPTMRAYKAARDAHGRLRSSGGHLKDMADWRRIEAEVAAAAGTDLTAAEAECLRWMRSMAGVLLCGEGKTMTVAEGAAAITELGLPTSPRQLADAGKNARKRGGSTAETLPKPPEAMAGFLARLEPGLGLTTISKHSVTLIARTKILMNRASKLPQVLWCHHDYGGKS